LRRGDRRRVLTGGEGFVWFSLIESEQQIGQVVRNLRGALNFLDL